MTPLNLIYDLRLRADDLGGDTGTPPSGFTYYWESDDSGALWKNAELIHFLNLAHREIAVRTQCYRDTEAELCTIRVKAGTAKYDIDPRILTIEDVLLASTGTSLIKTQLRDYRMTANTNTEVGTPTHYLEENRPFRFALYPIPVVDDTLYLTVYRLPLEDMTWAGRKSDVDEPPEQLREALVQGALSYAYQKRDADTGDGGRQKFHAMEFEKLIGKPVDYKVLENRRANANLNVTIRPEPYVRRRGQSMSWERWERS
jgi:hypothetical protein